ncbi:TPA: hypothetical protein MB809_001452 [Klebsiella pneumoniae]|nr:hypothetical protein [Klebsiella pneumoniae]HBT5149601.1 hypothetical protein [Klebsiella pneumoniae]HBX0008888.1 hypothetical protein [Klebsiella pneumoniae]
MRRHSPVSLVADEKSGSTITLQAVNELIATLESAGEPSIREQKFLKLAKAFKQLAAENVALKATSDDRRMFIMNGVQLGYIKVPTVETDPALETIRIAVSPQEPTPATDRIVAGIKADGVEEFASYISLYNSNAERHAIDFAKQLREGANQ